MGGVDPAVSYYSSDDDASIRVESRKSSDPEEVYLELRNQDNKNGWKVGMNDDYKLHMGWGPVGTMNQLTEALRLDPDSNLHFSTCDDGWMPMTHQRIDLLDH